MSGSTEIAELFTTSVVVFGFPYAVGDVVKVVKGSSEFEGLVTESAPLPGFSNGLRLTLQCFRMED